MRYLLLLPLLLLTSCAGKDDVAIYASHYAAMDTHNGQQTLQVSQKAQAISSMVAINCTDDSAACGMAKAMSAVVGAMMIADITARDFDQPMPTTSLDAQIKALDVIGKGIPFLTVGVVSYKAVAEDRGTVNVSGDNGATVSNSYEENHATNFGDDAAANNHPGQSIHEAPEEEEEESSTTEESTEVETEDTP